LHQGTKPKRKEMAHRRGKKCGSSFTDGKGKTSVFPLSQGANRMLREEENNREGFRPPVKGKTSREGEKARMRSSKKWEKGGKRRAIQGGGGKRSLSWRKNLTCVGSFGVTGG